MGWKPIETAPRDGTVILLYMRGEVAAGYYCGDEFFPWIVFDNGAEGDTNGWHDNLYGPTHWMPLPKPPKGDMK